MPDSQFPVLTPHIFPSDAAAAIDFYKRAFGAQEITRHNAPDGKRIMHARLEILGAPLMLSDEFPEYAGGKSNTPQALGGTPITLHLHVDDADALWKQAVDAGATIKMPLQDQFWGDYYGQLTDPFGFEWSVGQTKRQLSHQEIEEASKPAFGRADQHAH